MTLQLMNSFCSSQQDDALLTFLLDTELQSMNSSLRSSDLNNSSIGIARVKPDPDMSSILAAFHNRALFDGDRFDVRAPSPSIC